MPCLTLVFFKDNRIAKNLGNFIKCSLLAMFWFCSHCFIIIWDVARFQLSFLAVSSNLCVSKATEETRVDTALFGECRDEEMI